MNKSALKAQSLGEVVNLMSVDCQRVQDSFLYSYYIAILFFVTIIGFVQLYIFMGKCVVVVVAVIIVVVITIFVVAITILLISIFIGRHHHLHYPQNYFHPHNMFAVLPFFLF